MKNLLIVLTILLLSPFSLAGSNGKEVRLYVNGAIVKAMQLEKGKINYYYSRDREDVIVQAGPNNFHQEKLTVERYFIGTEGALEEVTPTNYKMLIKKYLPHAPELHKRLGKHGFRFDNVRYMIQYYNKFKT